MIVHETGDITDILLQSQRLSTCNRGRVAAVIRLHNDDNACVIGYSHSMTDVTCDTDGHELDNNGAHCVRTIHAEVMAIAKAASMGLSTCGSTCYVTRLPCESCIRILRCANVRRVVVYETVEETEQEWRDRKAYAQRLGVLLQSYKNREVNIWIGRYYDGQL